MPKATVAIEDRRFYEHGGIDVEGIARALWKNVSAGEVVEGGSTITQQLVRNLYIGRERTVERKLKEACLAIKLNNAWSKDRILATYMNQVYYGNLAYGIEAAAQTYFSKHASRAEPARGGAARRPAAGALAPTTPSTSTEIATARRNQVLRAMLNEGEIDQEQYDWAVAARLGLKAGKLYRTIREPYFFSYVRDELIAEYGAATVRSGGLKVYTTIDPRFQRAAQKAIRETLYERDDPAAAVISINPRNGAIRAMTAVTPGNAKNQFNLLSQAGGSRARPSRRSSSRPRSRRASTRRRRATSPLPSSTGPNPNGELRGRRTWWCPETYDHSYTGWTYDRAGDAPLRQHGLRAADARRHARGGGEDGAEARRPLEARRRRRLRAVDRPRRDGRVAARHGFGVRDARRRRDLLGADGDPQGRPPDGEDTNAGWGKPKRKRVISDGVAYTVTRILEENIQYGTGAGAELRAARGREDGHDRGALGRLVLRLHAEARDDRLGRLPEGRRSR